MSGVWKYRYHDFFVNETQTDTFFIIGMGEYPWYRVIHGFGDYLIDHHSIEIMIKEESLDLLDKIEVE